MTSSVLLLALFFWADHPLQASCSYVSLFPSLVAALWSVGYSCYVLATGGSTGSSPGQSRNQAALGQHCWTWRRKMKGVRRWEKKKRKRPVGCHTSGMPCMKALQCCDHTRLLPVLLFAGCLCTSRDDVRTPVAGAVAVPPARSTSSSPRLVSRDQSSPRRACDRAKLFGAACLPVSTG